jgi:hypothetical protein
MVTEVSKVGYFEGKIFEYRQLGVAYKTEY